jgi:replicative DNA helicase
MVRMDARMKHEHALGGVETGFHDLDSLCGGLHNSELIILAARPSMGKTAFAMNIAEHVAIGVKMPVLFVSLEMASLELADRLAAGGFALSLVELAQLVEQPLRQLEQRSEAWPWRDWLIEPVEGGRWRLRRDAGRWPQRGGSGGHGN